jgi:hypothetical protein
MNETPWRSLGDSNPKPRREPCAVGGCRPPQPNSKGPLARRSFVFAAVADQVQSIRVTEEATMARRSAAARRG